MATPHFVFVDPELAADTDQVRRVMHAPTPYPGNPLVFDSDFCDREKITESAEEETGGDDQHAYVDKARVAEGTHRWFNPSIFGRVGQIHSVVRSPLTGKLQMYYPVIGGLNLTDIGTTGGAFPTCYAESDDGIHWHMPNLGKFKVWGSGENNIMFAPPAAAYVRIDPHQPDPEKRYIAFVHHGPRIYTSPDGINWSRPIRAQLETKIGRSDGDTFVGWNPAIGKYMALFRPWKEYPEEPEGRQLFRRIGWAMSDDLEHWYDHQCILSADEKDGPTAQIERLLAWPYQDFYLGLALVMKNFTEERRRYSFMMGSIYNELCFSRDTVRWHRFEERAPFLSAIPGVRSRGMILPADAPIEVEEELLFYYSQTQHLHGQLPNFENFAVAKLMKDRFSSWAAGAEEGFVETRPLVCPGGRLRINADVREGDLRVGVILADGRHSVEHAAYRCNYIYGEQPSHTATWQRTADLEACKGQEVRLKFYLRNAEVFSFWFE